ncbi:MAG: beta-N-acetylhexosaminidase [Nitrospirota bacterium]|nr:beta-N-acetylhexosaminidase [Nitrospirota bacterium]MDE3241439.1 beta-N-acetylhexosaminidase [Nitrospirota bacterium]
MAHSLREQIGQLFMLGFMGTSVTPELADFIATYKPGGVILFKRNLESVAQIVQLTNDLQKLSPHSPLLISIDQEGGRVSRLPAGFTIFPPCASLGTCGSYDLAYAAASVTATELHAVGINMNMAPVLDVHTNPANPIIGDRAFGSDPALVSDLGEATFKGLQDNKVVACGKHFPGHGDTIADSHKELPLVNGSRERLEAIELPPFHHAFQRGLASLMTAHVLYPALDDRYPATLSPTILTGLLRGQMGFDGLVLTDDMEMQAIMDHYGIGDASVRAFQAGADVVLICKEQALQVAALEAFTKAVEDGTIPQARVEASLRRVALVKQRFLHPYKPADLLAATVAVGTGSHRALHAQLLQAVARLKASA